MYTTGSFARIRCSKCGAELTVLKPGQEFGTLPACNCNTNSEPTEDVKKPTRRKKVEDA